LRWRAARRGILVFLLQSKSACLSLSGSFSLAALAAGVAGFYQSNRYASRYAHENLLLETDSMKIITANTAQTG
jgi:hypothetical protein